MFVRELEGGVVPAALVNTNCYERMFLQLHFVPKFQSEQ
jgi:hypothetical protein